MSQKEQILAIIRKDGAISKRIADGYRIENLKGRISELRKAGHVIETTFKYDLTGKKYASYHFPAEQAAAA